MKTLLGSLSALMVLAWGWDIVNAVPAAGPHQLWIARQEALYLSGLLSIAMMSLAMFLATRPVWLELPLGGMDRIYRSHKWAGILAVSFAASHWLIEMSDDILKSMIGREGRVPKEKYVGFLEVLRDLAKDMGEWAIYAVLAMLVITLWKKVPYRTWRFLHRAMPVLYLMLAFHAALLAPRDYWLQPVGALLAVLLVAGVYGAIHSMLGGIGRSRLATGNIVAIENPSDDITTVRCHLAPGWHGHHPGQFAFVTFDDNEGAHPFTIASADQGDNVISFQIKALGDYTRGLARRLQPGQMVRVEGPYGRFDLARRNPRARQIWIAGGIGVTPFLAWLESLQGKPELVPEADLHYCTRDQARDSFVPRLESLCAGLPGIRLHIHDARQGAILKADALGATKDTEIWFCGPSGLGNALRNGIRAMGWTPRFHQEAFEMR
ncbi:MAG: ferric reductase-like transmembrane domain-containing protein [Rhodocyclaceae bacterium]|jgi:predicted ferric reductase|nr:ferric reductase-like transmembrane domain-containing protein [Rhodocyclaceae bacterium]